MMRLRESKCTGRPLCACDASVSGSLYTSGGAEKGANLFIDWVSIPEDHVATNEAGEEGVKVSLFATVCLLLD